MYIFNLVGASHRPPEAQNEILGLVRGDEVVLERDPSNEYDPNAIRVIANGHWIGFVPRDTARDLAPLLDEGIPFKAKIQAVRGKSPEIEASPVGVERKIYGE